MAVLYETEFCLEDGKPANPKRGLNQNRLGDVFAFGVLVILC